jgi:hypothetical protein
MKAQPADACLDGKERGTSATLAQGLDFGPTDARAIEREVFALVKGVA